MNAENAAATVRSAQFKGLYQEKGGYAEGLEFAADGGNFSCEGGKLQPFSLGEELPGALNAAIGTLAALHRRYYTAAEEDARLLVAACGGSLYARSWEEEEWEEIFSGLSGDEFDFVSYEVNGYYQNADTGRRMAKEEAQQDWWIDADAPIDILLLSNATDGMICVYGDTREAVRVKIQPDGAEEVRFGVLARHAERIWGSGIAGDPDKLMYSAPFDPFDWNANVETPEDGAGDILQPSWDGDSFVALRPMGSQLLAVKRRRIWRILGTNPSEYVMKEQYGGGTLCENSLVVHGSEALMLSRDGLILYDGACAQPFAGERIRGVLDRICWESAWRACAAMRGEIYCLALPLDASPYNNAILEYDTRTGAFCLRENIGVRAFLEMEGQTLFTSDGGEGKVYSLSGGGAAIMRWIGTWQDLGRRDCVKRQFQVRLETDAAAKLRVGVRTERGFWSHLVRTKPGKTAVVALPGRGKRFRVEIASEEAQAFAIVGGMQADCELDWE